MFKFDVYEGNFEFEHIGEGVPRLSFKFFNGKWQWKTIGKTEYADILDDIDYTHATRGLGNVLGFKTMNPRQMQRRLAQLGTFSGSLNSRSYTAEARDNIIGNIIRNISNHAFLSFYLNPN